MAIVEQELRVLSKDDLDQLPAWMEEVPFGTGPTGLMSRHGA